MDHAIGQAERGRSAALTRRFPHEKAVVIVYTVTMFMSIMDSQIVNVALASLSRDFRVTTASVQWVVTSYLMSIAVFVPASGWLGDRFGTKKIYLIAVGAFTAASLLCAASSNFPELVAMRILQGMGGGMMVPVGMAMLYRAYPPSQRVQVARLITRVMVLAPAMAPLIGGSLVTWGSWRWIFTINLPFGLVAIAFGSAFLVEHREPREGTFDLLGALSGGVGLGLLLYAVGSGPTNGWGSSLVLVSGAVALFALGIFVRQELRRSHPLLNLGLLANRMFRRSCALIGCSTIAFFGSLVFTALYLQEGRGFSAIQSGLSTFPEAIGVGVSSQFVARLFPRVGPRRLLAIGFSGLVVGTFVLSRADLSTNLWEIRGTCFFLGVSLAFNMLSNQAAAFSQISPASTGHASAIYNTIQRASSSLGVALLSTVLALAGGNVVHRRIPMAAFHWVFGTSALLAGLGVLLALRIHDEDAAAAMGT